MCGIAGFLDLSRSTSDQVLRRTAGAMAETLRHRGPDDGGVWVEAEAGIALGHRRLSILDLSPTGSQPVLSQNERFAIAYNGEVYNFEELRKELEAAGQSFRGHSDTEVILEACAARGLEPAVKSLIGMFAFALWDRQTRTLTLVRDRLGIKPLYWGLFGSLFLFGSELKALCAHPGWTPEIDRDALAAFMRHNYVPAPHSIYRGINKLGPGQVLTLRDNGSVRIESYWDLQKIATNGIADRRNGNDRDAVDELEELLRDAVGRRMVADVPLGAFLSGGVDSSSVVALMQAQSPRPVKTFSIGFNEAGYDEAKHAKAVAAHLGTDHTELYVEPGDAQEIIPRLSEWYDEPFADSSQIPTFLVSEMTRRHVTVALSGDGGDEVFAGYNRYFWAESLWRRLGWLPPALRRGTAAALRLPPPGFWDHLFHAVPPRWRPGQAGDKVYKLADILTLTDCDALYRCLISMWQQPDSLVLSATEPKGVLWDEEMASKIPAFLERMQFMDMATYLPDDILTKVDRASMAVSLEVRVPLLDHRVVEFAWRLPRNMKIRNGESKWILRQILYKHVPRNLIERPKMGFGVPIDHWLRNDLRDWAEDLLDESRLRQEGFLKPEPIRRKWAEHQSGRRNWQYQLWPVLMFQLWLGHKKRQGIA